MDSTRSIFINLVKYGIELNSILTNVGHISSNTNRALFHITRGPACTSQTLQEALQDIS